MKTSLLVEPTNGCEYSNFLKTKLLLFLEQNGLQKARGVSSADLIVINTCAFSEFQKKTAEEGVERVVEECQQSNPGATVVVFGCLPRLSEKVRQMDSVICVNPDELSRMDEILKSRITIEPIAIEQIASDDVSARGIASYQKLFQPSEAGVWVPIGQGCSLHCSYCNIKKVKGAAKSRPLAEIVDEIAAMVAKGHERFTLLADDCSSYGHDLGLDFIDLLDGIAERCPSAVVNIYYFYPGLFLRYFQRLKVHLDAQRVGHINIPMQAASNRILKLMNRAYDAAEVFAAIGETRRLSPRSKLLTHYIFGFPTESNADFEAMLTAPAVFDEITFIRYSDNREAPASQITPKVDLATCEERARRLKQHLRDSQQAGIVVMEPEVTAASPLPPPLRRASLRIV